MYAMELDEEGAAAWLDEVLADVGGTTNGVAKKAKAKVGATALRVPRAAAASRGRVSVWAILVAAGRGERLGVDRPKAFARLRGRPLLAESLERLDESEWVDEIVVAAPEGWVEPAVLLAEELGCGKVVSVVAGGAERTDSVRSGLAEVAEDATVVLVHDAARPLLPADVIERVLVPLSEGWDAVVPGLPIPDTVKRVERDTVVETVDREGLVRSEERRVGNE